MYFKMTWKGMILRKEFCIKVLEENGNEYTQREKTDNHRDNNADSYSGLYLIG
jgi:hypothetical protein